MFLFPMNMLLNLINVANYLQKAPLKSKGKVKCVKMFVEKFFKNSVRYKVSLFPFFRLLLPRYDRL